VDDSIVRGTTMRQIVKLLRDKGAREVHVRISSPPIMHPCYYGIDISRHSELIASEKTVSEIREYLGADSLGYLTIEGLLSCVDNPEDYCTACFSGKYCTPIPDEFDKYCDDSVFDDAVKRGSYIRAYARTFISKIVKKAVHRRLCGYDTLVVNSAHWISEIGANLSKSTDIALVWYFDHEAKEYKCSLRSAHEDMDVAVVATKFGGNGHPSSSGFQFSGASIEDIFDKADGETNVGS